MKRSRKYVFVTGIRQLYSERIVEIMLELYFFKTSQTDQQQFIQYFLKWISYDIKSEKSSSYVSQFCSNSFLLGYPFLLFFFLLKQLRHPIVADATGQKLRRYWSEYPNTLKTCVLPRDTIVSRKENHHFASVYTDGRREEILPENVFRRVSVECNNGRCLSPPFLNCCV